MNMLHDAYAKILIELERAKAERDALHKYCAALERALENGRKALDAHGRATRKARTELRRVLTS
jgi:hypothetical protein